MPGHDEDADRAAARRAFIRSSHPDVGGDPAAFVEGLASFDRPSSDNRPDASARPAVRRSRRPDRIVKRTLRDLRRRLAGGQPRRLQ